MWKQLIVGLAFAGFVGLQIVNGLTCYTCNSPANCLNPSSQVCNDGTANQTSAWLNEIHSDVRFVDYNDSNVYKCMNLTYFYYDNFTRNAEILGCFHTGIPVCSLTLNATNSNRWARTCRTCATDNCNRNPAGTIIKSPYIIMVSLIALLLSKFVI